MEQPSHFDCGEINTLPSSAVSFSTYRAGQLRTVGTGYRLPARWGALDDWNDRDAQALARMVDPLQDCTAAAARGKVFFLSLGSEREGMAALSCFQVKEKRSDPVYCGNSTAAAAALHAEASGQPGADLSVRCGQQAVVARTRSVFEPDGWQVSQQWRLAPSDEIEETELVGHRAVFCRLLNDYVLVLGPLRVDLETLIAAAGGISTLRSRIAILQPADPIAQARFLNCNGVHGAAPQTGLATIALVASRVGWVREVVGKGQLLTPGGIEVVPDAATEAGGKLALNLPRVRVVLRHLAFGM